MQPLYDPEGVRPMWEELAECGVEPVQTRENVDEALKRPGTTLVVVNSVCGCAAGSARPGVTRALQHSTIPDHLTTVFAGVDREATERAREHMVGVAPSSPSVALFKDGELVHMLERRHIEMMNDEMVAQNLTEGFRQVLLSTGTVRPQRRVREDGARAAVWLLGAAVQSPLKPLAGALLPGKVPSRPRGPFHARGVPVLCQNSDSHDIPKRRPTAVHRQNCSGHEIKDLRSA